MATVGEILRVAIHYTQPNAGDCMNVFHFKLTGSVAVDLDVAQAAEDWITLQWAPQWKTIASGQAVLNSAEFDIVALDGTVTRNIGGGLYSTAGTVVSEVTSAAVSAYLLAYTAIPKARGSKYVPGMAEGNIANGVFLPAVLAQLAILLTKYLLVYTSAGGVVMTPGVASATLLQFVPFLISGALESLPAYQRRRKAGVGI